jgi:hypothetical protein
MRASTRDGRARSVVGEHTLLLHAIITWTNPRDVLAGLAIHVIQFVLLNRLGVHDRRLQTTLTLRLLWLPRSIVRSQPTLHA